MIIRLELKKSYCCLKGFYYNHLLMVANTALSFSSKEHQKFSHRLYVLFFKCELELLTTFNNIVPPEIVFIPICSLLIINGYSGVLIIMKFALL